MNKNNFPFNLRSYRKDLGLSLEQLSKKTGISFSTLGYYERGLKSPTLYSLLILADFFNFTLNDLCAEEFAPFSEEDKEKIFGKIKENKN